MLPEIDCCCKVRRASTAAPKSGNRKDCFLFMRYVLQIIFEHSRPAPVVKDA